MHGAVCEQVLVKQEINQLKLKDADRTVQKAQQDSSLLSGDGLLLSHVEKARQAMVETERRQQLR